MWIPTSPTSKAWITWRPPNQAHLHYDELYRSVWEFLRMPPRRENEARAREYLDILREYPGSHLQQDRIRWVEAWLKGLDMEERRRRRLGEEKYALLTWVCYEPPPVIGGRGGWEPLRAG